MVIGSTWDGCDAALLALTALERWAAAKKVYPRSTTEEYSTILAIALLLVALVILLWWVSHKRNVTPRVPARDLFSDAAARRGLEPRERQVLLAIVARSGLRRSHDIFTTPDAFEQGAAKLLEECAGSRTPQDSERLRAEVAGLRERLAYRTRVRQGQAESASDLTLHAPAIVARFPFIQAAVVQPADAVPTDWLELVRGVVTCVSDTSLQVSSPLRSVVGERVLVVFALAPAGADDGAGEASGQGHIVGHVGRVKHRQAAGEETVITVDLLDLEDREVDELVRLAQAAAADVGGPAGARMMQGA